MISKIAETELEITSVERKKAMEHPPKLFDLTLLQVECNKKYAFTAENTLKIIQSLYDKKLTDIFSASVFQCICPCGIHS